MPCFRIRFGWQYSAELLECYLKLSLIIVCNSVELCFDSIIIVADVIDMWDIYHVHHDCHLNSAYKYETTPSSWGTNLRKEADVNEQPLSYSDTKAQRREITVYNPIHYTFFLRMCATKFDPAIPHFWDYTRRTALTPPLDVFSGRPWTAAGQQIRGTQPVPAMRRLQPMATVCSPCFLGQTL